MKKLLELIAVIALLNLGGAAALADEPLVAATPDIRTEPQSPSAGGSATANGGDAGPAAVSSSEPITVSSAVTPAPGAGQSHGSTTASGPGTRASAPLNSTTAEPDPATPDGSAPAVTTSGPEPEADASQTSISMTESGDVRATLRWTAANSFGASAEDTGSVQDPTFASSCSTAEVNPGTPTDVSLGTSCGGTSTSASEDLSATGANGTGAGGTPTGSSCLAANASAGVSPSADIADACGSSGATTPSTNAPATGGNGGSGRTAAAPIGTTGLAGTNGLDGIAGIAAQLGLESLPFTGTTAETLGYPVGLIGVVGLLVLYLRRMSVTWELARERVLSRRD